MTESEIRESIGTAPLPRPRTAADDTVAVAVTEAAQYTAAPQLEAAHFPWPEPWHFSRGARPRSEFWNARTGSWRSRGPVRPAPSPPPES
jgi:hypothetical protein